MSQIIADIYEIDGKIGSGGGGIVYLGRHLRLQKPVVLKADKRTLNTKREALRREVDMLKNLSHSYIPQVYDFVQDNGVVYTVMDYIEGESLDKVLKRGEKIAQAAEKKLSYEEASVRDIEAAIAKAQEVIDARGSDAEIAAAMRELEQALANGEKKSVQDDPGKENELTPTGEVGNHTRTGSILVTDGGSLTEDKLHFSVAEGLSQKGNTLHFAPAEENCIRLIRDGKVYSIGIPEKKSLVVSGANAYLSLMNLQLNELMPLCDGDVLVISGDFLCADEKLAVTIPESFLLIQGDRSVKESAESNVIQALLSLLTGSGE